MNTLEMRSEPKRRRDGKCVVCKKPVTVAPHVEPDAFCSTVCCRLYFGTTLIVSPSST